MSSCSLSIQDFALYPEFKCCENPELPKAISPELLNTEGGTGTARWCAVAQRTGSEMIPSKSLGSGL